MGDSKEIPRTCGSCTACCKTHRIRELNKKAGSWCLHCNIGHGCNIYGQHPQSCKDFKCAWLLGASALAERPDVVKIVKDHIEIESLGDTVFLFETTHGTLANRFSQKETEHYLLYARKPVVHYSLFGKVKLFLPRGIKPETIPIFTIDGQAVEIVPYNLAKLNVKHTKLIKLWPSGSN